MSNSQFLKKEFIGSNLKIPQKNICGKIIDESKNTFEIISEGKRKKVNKSQKLIIEVDNKKIMFNGKIIQMRPEERIRLKIKN